MILQNPYIIIMEEYISGRCRYTEYLRVNAISLKSAAEKIKKSFFREFKGEFIVEEFGNKTFVLAVKLDDTTTYQYNCLGKIDDLKEIS